MENKFFRIAVTGASGFVGKRFLSCNEGKYQLTPIALREQMPRDIDLSGIDVVLHLAGKAHDMQPVPDEVYYDINYTLTKLLAEKAKADGVRHFIYISSTKVYGDEINEKLDEKSPCNPTDAYGKSKYQAEELLRYMSTELFKVAIIRPPLVYGPEVKGNMLRLMDLAKKNYPLPFGNSRNARSMVYIDNLLALIDRIIETQAMGTFIAGDMQPVSTDSLISEIRSNMGRKQDLVTVPSLFRGLLKMVRPSLYTRLFGSFVVDNTSTNKILSFSPPYTTQHGIAEMVKWYTSPQRT